MGDRYFRAGTSKFLWSPSAPASPTQVTMAEASAATDVSPDVADWDGFTTARGAIPTPDLATDYEGNIPGKRTSGNPRLTIYERKADQVFWDLLNEDAAGYIFYCPEGVAATRPVEIWNLRVLSRFRNQNRDDGATFNAEFTAPTKPYIDGTIVA